MENLCFKCGNKNLSPKSKFCSQKCRLNGYEKICEYCKKKFLARYNSKYCSRICAGQINQKIATNATRKPPAEYRLCKMCNEEKRYNEYRQVNKNLNKGFKKRGGWLDIEGKRRYTYCQTCEVNWSSKKYRINPYRQIYYVSKKRALAKGIPFTLTREDYKELYANCPKLCPVLGIKINHSEIGSTKHQTDNSPSIDRITPSKGYVKGNVMIISALANRIKTDASIDQIKKVYEFLKKIKKKGAESN